MVSLQRILTIFLCWVAVLCIASETTRASSLNLSIRDSVINIQADKVPLINILRAVSDKTGLYIVSGDPMMESVSCVLKDITVEDSIKRLLKNRNYVITYKVNGDGVFAPSELMVFGNGLVKTLNTPGSHVSQGPPEDPMRRYKKEWFKKEFEDGEKLLKQITTRAENKGSDARGILITRLAKGSSFQNIGLDEGDIIADVNGEPVQTTQEFIKALQKYSEDEMTMVRIERFKKDGMIDPIYMELH